MSTLIDCKHSTEEDEATIKHNGKLIAILCLNCYENLETLYPKLHKQLVTKIFD